MIIQKIEPKDKIYVVSITIFSIVSICVILFGISMSAYLCHEVHKYRTFAADLLSTRTSNLFQSCDCPSNSTWIMQDEFITQIQILYQWRHQFKEGLRQYLEQETCFLGSLSPWNINVTGKVSFGSSCSDIMRKNPGCLSGNYWIQSLNNSPILVYCDMDRMCGNVTGGWMRAVHLNMTKTSFHCPPGLCLYVGDIHACRICTFTGGCSLDTFPIGVKFSKVCGRVIGYQKGTLDAFHSFIPDALEGVIISHGSKNIWAFAAAVSETFYDSSNTVCQCINKGDIAIPSPPAAFGNHYFCDSGFTVPNYRPATYYTFNPLWDGDGCGGTSTCCSFNNPPWFFRELPEKTSDDIQVRVCRDQDRNNEDIAITNIDIYVQ